MNDRETEWETLRRAVEIPASALTAVEVDTEHRAKDLISWLSPDLGNRPFVIVETALEESATEVFQRCREQIREWPLETGVLFVVFKGGYSESDAIDFWREMNALRESWAGLQCHVIFFLLPTAFRMLLQIADHLADWISLRLHFLVSEGSTLFEKNPQDRNPVFYHGMLSPSVAYQNLQRMEEGLRNALKRGEKESSLIRRFYLPMLEAAVELRELRRAKNIRAKIEDQAVSSSERSRWYQINWLLDYSVYDLDAARIWAEKLLSRGKRTGNNIDISDAYHLLGVIAKERRDFETAEDYYSKSLSTKKKYGAESDTARTFHQLGMIAEEKRDFETAEYWFQKSLVIENKNENEHGAGITYHQLGRVAQERRDFETAEKWYHKSLAIEKVHGNDFGAAITYHQLGRIAQERKDFDTAEDWYRKSLSIKNGQGNEYGLSITYHNLGQISQERGNFKAAENWYRKSLSIKKRHSNEHGSAITYYSIGILFQIQKDWLESARWLSMAIRSFSSTDSFWRKQRAVVAFENILREAPVELQKKLKNLWIEAGLEDMENSK